LSYHPDQHQKTYVATRNLQIKQKLQGTNSVNTRVKRWLIKEQNQTLSKTFSRSLNISPLVSQLLINRGITTIDEADYFLNATLKNLHSPLLMKHMDKAVERVVAAIKIRKKSAFTVIMMLMVSRQRPSWSCFYGKFTQMFFTISPIGLKMAMAWIQRR